jgi:hypothetical protein
MEQLIPAIITEKEENDSLVCCMSWGATDILERKKRRTLFRFIGRYWRDSEVAYREFFSFERLFYFIWNVIKEGITAPSCNGSSNSCLQLMLYKKYKRRVQKHLPTAITIVITQKLRCGCCSRTTHRDLRCVPAQHS